VHPLIDLDPAFAVTVEVGLVHRELNPGHLHYRLADQPAKVSTRLSTPSMRTLT
jgi:hypothetical protein